VPGSLPPLISLICSYGVPCLWELIRDEDSLSPARTLESEPVFTKTPRLALRSKFEHYHSHTVLDDYLQHLSEAFFLS
jgi:hypothetical protein